jgi:uncharacterized protein (TIGR02145 family)
MKKILLLIMCIPAILSAQTNGVTVGNLVVTTGSPTTVTFDVSWAPLTPPAVWSDTVWVFVDHNDNGTMKRLELLSAGATLTATSAPDDGRVEQLAGNTKGVRVIGDARINSSFSATVQLLTATTNVAGACAYASNYPPVAEYATASSVTFTGTPPFDLKLSTGNVSVQAGYELVGSQTLVSFTDKTGAPGIIPGYNQPQGGCTFTQPAVLTTFANFSTTYSASSFVTLTDERDNNNYTVVKIGGRWIMAQNLNYQKDLTWEPNSNSPSTGTGSNTVLIGSFWCPGGFSSSTPTSTRASCDVWGALYSWETAMSLDGKITSAWSDYNTSYCGNGEAAKSTDCQRNWGRATSSGGGSVGGRGICPPNWHVPTDHEWGIILDGMEDGGSVHQDVTTNAWVGTNAGSRGKSKCTVADQQTSGAAYVDDTQANWYYNASTLGTDYYNFRVLPSGCRNDNGSYFHNRGYYAYFWSSSAYDGSNAWRRTFNYNYATVYRANGNRSYGFSVRCIRDL